ncbi:MAG: hypothetical protein J7521_03025 [Caulobacter sp.]|nr:hypothetical protein [Caulobacter sp.]
MSATPKPGRRLDPNWRGNANVGNPRSPDLIAPPTPTPEAVRLQLTRLEASETFAGSARLLAFLRFVVEETLEGRSQSLREVLIGNAIYGREPPYDSRIDSTVRVEARRLRRKLQEHYAASPDEVIIDLPTGGYTPTFTQRATGGALPGPPRHGDIFREGQGASIAIMPFRAIPRTPDVETFAEGLTDELIYEMGKADGIWITSRSTVFQFASFEGSAAELATALKVDAVLQGVVRHDGDQLRVTVEASDRDGLIVWSDRFDAPDSQRFQLQEKIAKTLLSRARLDSSKMREMRIGPGPVALKALAKVYRARLLLDQQTPDSVADAMRLFKDVAETAPDYARGHTGVADGYCDLFRLGLIERSEALSKAHAAVESALAIDGGSTEANAAQATIHAWLERDPIKAEAAFQATLRLGVNARATRHYGVFLSLLGDHDRALRLFQEAREIEPFSSSQDIAEAIAHFEARRYDLLTATGDRAFRQQRPPEALAYVILAHLFGGDRAAAQGLLDELEPQCARRADLIFLCAEVEVLLGRPDRAQRLATATLDRGTGFARATLHAALGDEARAIEALGLAIDRGELSTAWMRTDPRFDAMRDSPPFQRLLARLQPFDDRAA